MSETIYGNYINYHYCYYQKDYINYGCKDCTNIDCEYNIIVIPINNNTIQISKKDLKNILGKEK